MRACQTFTRRSRLLALLFAAGGCARVYEPSEPTPARAAGATAALRSVRAYEHGQIPVDVSLRLSTPPDTEIVDARLSLRLKAPCSAGVPPLVLSVNGRPHARGPVAVRGDQRVDMVFPAHVTSARRATVVDVQLASNEADGPSICLRVPLTDAGVERDPWGADAEGAGPWIDTGFSVLSTVGGLPGEPPRFLIFERVGVVFDRQRVWAEIEGGPDAAGERGTLLLGAGADRRLLGAGRFGFRLGASYQLALQTRFVEGETADLEAVLHGPRLLPSLTFALPSPTTTLGLPRGDRTLHLHLDAPAALWFGTGDAPGTVLAVGVGLGLSVGL